jgi:hypothetical protein
MRPLIAKVRPAAGYAKILHNILVILLPIALFVLVYLNFVQLAFSLVLLSKWRMVAVKPRFWPANIRANLVDIVVGLSVVVFMTQGTGILPKLIWAILYAVWLIVIKPANTLFMTSAQAFTAQLCGLVALYLSWSNGPLYGLTFLTGLMCYIAARHFFEGFDEPYSRLLSYIWAYFGASLAWLCAHWLIYYQFLSQPTLLLSTIGYGMATIYYLDHKDKLGTTLKRQIVLIMIAIVIVVFTFSNWGDKVV